MEVDLSLNIPSIIDIAFVHFARLSALDIHKIRNYLQLVMALMDVQHLGAGSLWKAKPQNQRDKIDQSLDIESVLNGNFDHEFNHLIIPSYKSLCIWLCIIIT